MSNSNVRIPPDSTGKKISTKTLLEIEYAGLTGDLVIGDEITGGTSGVLGTLSKNVSYTATTGEMYVELYHDAPEVVVNAESFTAVGSTPTGQGTFVGTGTPFYTTKVVVAGGNNSHNTQFVSAQGAASVRFPDGAPTLNGFGSLLSSELTTVGVYDFTADSAADLFSEITENSGSVTYLSEKSTVELSVTSASGSKAARVTNKYHFYWPGKSLLMIGTVALSDAGVAGNIRRWGLFDDNDGVFFEQSGSILNIVLRSSTSGVVVETRIPQNEWTLDGLDGAGLSLFTLDVTKILPYFIDYQWLGAGRVRFGVIGPSGDRIHCHTIENSGQNFYPYMAKGSLPLTICNQNYTSIGSTPSIRLTCAVVQNEGVPDYTFWRYSHVHPTKTVSGSMIPLIALRSKTLYQGKHNQTNVYPEEYNCSVVGGRVRLDFYWPVALQGDTFAVDNGTTVEIDVNASGSYEDADSGLQHSVFLADGCHTINLRPLFEINDEGILANADESPSWNYSVVATLISGSSAVVNGSFTYKELR